MTLVVGRLVKRLFLPITYSSLSTGVTWDGRDEEEKELQMGVYFLKADGNTIRKVVKVR